MPDKKEPRQKRNMLIHLMGPVRPCPIITDPQGCYTGKPIERMETPVQDVDDL